MNGQEKEINKFSVILADCPWPYNSRSPHSKTRFGGGVHRQYRVMQIEEIKALPLNSVAAKDAVLFLWATFPHLQNALEVIKSWGFKYKTLGFSWTKTTTKSGKLFFGTGFYAKSNTEVCLLATRGKTIKPSTNTVSSALLSPRLKHSQKPTEIHERIERLYPDLPKVELFARQQRDGWVCLGNEIDGLDIRDSIDQVGHVVEL